jgi:hypothetical protein
MRAISVELYERALAYVHTGADPGLIAELEQGQDPALVALLRQPGQIKRVFWLDPALKDRLKAVGFKPEEVVGARNTLYAKQRPAPDQLVRLGRLWSVIGSGPDRVAPDTPRWLTALVNDCVQVLVQDTLKSLRWADRPEWNVDLLLELLADAGVAQEATPAAVVGALLQRSAVPPRYDNAESILAQWPGLDTYLATHVDAITPAILYGLNATGRIALAELAARTAATATALAPVTAHLATDTAKSVRVAALQALAAAPPTARTDSLIATLTTTPAARLGPLVDYLSSDPDGLATLRRAYEAGAPVGAKLEAAAARQDVLDGTPAEDATALPPFEPAPDTPPGQQTELELRAMLNRYLTHNPDSGWAKRAREVTDADITAFLRALGGQGQVKNTPLAKFSTWSLLEALPSLGLLGQVRLIQSRYQFRNLIRRLPETDLRALEDALRRVGGWEVEAVVLEAVTTQSVTPESAWPYLAQHLDILEGWLRGTAEQMTTALWALGGFPQVPPSLLGPVAAVAVGESKVARRAAQEALANHGSARDLAEQALANSKAEIRQSAAQWLTRLGDPVAVPALRAALKTEKREVVRAAYLTALETLGDDITADLAPAVLVAEAVKGLKSKPPTSMAWFPLDTLPALAWADGSPVPPEVARWWVVLAVKLKDPDGSGLLDRYVSRLAPDSAAALGRHVLRAWIAQDIRHPEPEVSRAHAEKFGQARYQNYVDALKGARQRSAPDYVRYLEGEVAVPVEQRIAQVYAEHQREYVGSAIADKGLLGLTTRVPGIEVANAVQSYIKQHGGRRAQVETLVYTLYGNGQPAAIQLLLSVARRHNQATVQATAGRLVEQLAERRGWTPDELADRTIPTAGFDDDSLLRLSFGPREFIGRLTPAYTIELADADGKVLKALPSPRADDDEEAAKAAKSQLSAARKEVKSVLTLQVARLYEAMCGQRTWPVADWQEYLSGHPLVGRLVARLVWVADPGPDQRVFRPTEDGALVDLDDEAVELAPGSRIGLAHRMTIGAEASAAWQEHLKDYEVTPLFDQFSAVSPVVTAGAVDVVDRKGHLTDALSFRGVVTKRGYQRGSVEDAAWFTEYTKAFTALGLTAVIEFSGSYVPEEAIPVAVIALGFRGVKRQAVALTDVPPVLLAECYADYAALAALGPYDPDWERKCG